MNVVNSGPVLRRRGKARARALADLGELCRCGRGLAVTGRKCRLCANGDTPARPDAATKPDEPDLDELDCEPFEPDPPPALTTPPPAAPGDPLRCSTCGHRFGRRARCYLIDGAAGAVLCGACASSTAVHARLFIECRQRHTAGAHCTTVTRGAALRLQQDTPR
ncbi:hypothetical protein MSAS_22100 [Mycobacterium saskatchewanense]|uniref:Uncharacterized protein n=1 Tax=Mycobacterium saskatchewanense TaxID=220927 RepID=A0AAJ3NP92_9MYCO|nr:hypothetical protein [Mycobacterium saskatchewanense]ORW70670.1 hypothetical protein AWC23_16455 [Mycobacterium saskatchewanense]BBX63036.1 hypothetical protein MSAS_22100 [Mycobacterium saskatchewanense]